MSERPRVNRRTILETMGGAGLATIAGCSEFGGSGPEVSVALEDGPELPPLFDCNVWLGAPPDGRVSARLYRPPDDRGLDTADEILAEMDRVGIDIALTYDVTARTGNDRAGNDQLPDRIADTDRLLPTWVASPSIIDQYGSAPDLIDAMDAAGAHALRLYPGEHDYGLGDPAFDELWPALAEADIPLILDALSGVVQDGFTYSQLRALCENYEGTAPDEPQLTVLVTQLWPTMGTLSRMSQMVSAVRRVDNLYVDTARFQTWEGLRLFINRVGVRKLVFGTHLPHSSAGAGLGALMLADLEAEERRQVGAGNLARLLGGSLDDLGDFGAAPETHFKKVPYGIFDMHGHVRGNDPQRRYPDADGLVDVMDRVGIDLAVVSNLSGKAGNDIAAEAGEAHPDRLVPAMVGNPNWRGLRTELERSFDELGLGIIKIHPYSHDTPPDDPAYDPMWEIANEREALVVAHANCKGDERDAWIERANAYPDLTLMLYHAGRAWSTAPRFVSVANAADNVVLEITYSYNVDGIIEYLIEEAGADKVFFGSDIGARAPESQIGWATYARMDDDTRWRHMRENARQLLVGLDLLPETYE